MLVTTSTFLEGYKVTQHLGIIRGITVRSRGVGGNIMGGLQSIMGGKNSIYTELCETAREEAYELRCSMRKSMALMQLSICVMMPMKFYKA